MTCLSVILLGIALIIISRGNTNAYSGILTIRSSSSGSSLVPDFPEIVCTDENCLNEKLANANQPLNSYDDPIYFGQDHDWNKMDISGEVAQKRHYSVNSVHYAHNSSCSCKEKFNRLDLGPTYYPRHVVTATCQNQHPNGEKCWRRSPCKEIPYKLRILTHRPETESVTDDPLSTLLPDALRGLWKLETITVGAACANSDCFKLRFNKNGQ